MIIKEYFKGIIKDRYVLFSLVQRDLLTKYRKSKLGVAWSVLMPLGLAAILGGVYSILFNTSPQYLIPLVFSGINPWNFMSGSTDAATMAFPSAEGYIKQSTVSSYIFPLRIVLVNFVTLLFSILTFFGLYLFILPDRFSPIMLLCVPGLIIMFVFSLGLANISSIINIQVRDFAPLQSLILQGLFYATPIIYDPQILAERGYSIVYEINPIFYMLEIVRRPMMGTIPRLRYYGIAGIIAFVTLLFGIFLQMRYRKKIVYML